LRNCRLDGISTQSSRVDVGVFLPSVERPASTRQNVAPNAWQLPEFEDHEQVYSFQVCSPNCEVPLPFMMWPACAALVERGVRPTAQRKMLWMHALR